MYKQGKKPDTERTAVRRRVTGNLNNDNNVARKQKREGRAGGEGDTPTKPKRKEIETRATTFVDVIGRHATSGSNKMGGNTQGTPRERERCDGGVGSLSQRVDAPVTRVSKSSVGKRRVSRVADLFLCVCACVQSEEGTTKREKGVCINLRKPYEG